jgi:glycosyltransferase involved in cell wall biosynthesis
MNVKLEPWESYGLVGIQLLHWLDRLGVEVDWHGPNDLGGPATPAGGILLGTVDGCERKLSLFDGPRVAITMFESTRLPADWLPPLNNMDAVIVPSRFCAAVFAESGVRTPIHVIPLGVGDQYRFKERSKKEGTAAAPLTFLAFLDRGERKGGQTALQAFVRAFGDDMRYRLILKSRRSQMGLSFTNPNIETIQADLSEGELVKLYQRADVLINPHCGEGFGMIPREFAATGGLALTTAFSGTADELPLWGMGIPYKLVPSTWRDVPKHAGQNLGEWARVNVDEVAQTLREIARDWPKLQPRLRSKATACRRLYDWCDFAEDVLGVWKGITKGGRAWRSQTTKSYASTLA